MEFYKHQQIHSSSRRIPGVQNNPWGRMPPPQVSKPAWDVSCNDYILNRSLENLLMYQLLAFWHLKTSREKSDWKIPCIFWNLLFLYLTHTGEKHRTQEPALPSDSMLIYPAPIRLGRKTLSMRWSFVVVIQEQEENTTTSLQLDFVPFNGILPMLII